VAIGEYVNGAVTVGPQGPHWSSVEPLVQLAAWVAIGICGSRRNDRYAQLYSSEKIGRCRILAAMMANL
jgi:hypothetical protein